MDRIIGVLAAAVPLDRPQLDLLDERPLARRGVILDTTGSMGWRRCVLSAREFVAHQLLRGSHRNTMQMGVCVANDATRRIRSRQLFDIDTAGSPVTRCQPAEIASASSEGKLPAAGAVGGE
jgi:hypothetical protein